MMTHKASIFISILIISFLSTCTPHSSNTWKNDNINDEFREYMEAMNSSVVEFLYYNDMDQLKGMCSEAMLNAVDDNLFDDQFSRLHEYMKAESHSIVDQFHSVNTQKNITNLYMEDKYLFKFKSTNKETYTSILEVEAIHNHNFLIGITYGFYEESDDFKIDMLYIGRYKSNGKTAIDYFEISQRQYEKGHLINAANSLNIAENMLKPLDIFWTYRNEPKIKFFRKQVLEEINNQYNLPKVITEVSSSPSIVGIESDFYRDEVVTIINYLTKIDIADTVRLKKEYLDINEEVEELFKGITKETKYIVYRPIDEIPDGTKTVNYYSFIHELTNK